MQVSWQPVNLADAREGDGQSYIWVHSNSLIKNLTPFEDDPEIRFLIFLMQSICKQLEGTFIKKMASPKIDFYFEVFKQLKNDVLSHLTKATQHRDTGIY